MSSQDRPRLLIASLSFIQRDPRVLRQINELSSDWDTTVCGYGLFEDPRVRMVALDHQPRSRVQLAGSGARMAVGMHSRDYWRRGGPAWRTRVALSAEPRFDLAIANDLDILPAILSSLPESAVLADAHEYTPDQFGGRGLRERLLRQHGRWLTDRFVPHADAVMTVCDGLADAYATRLGIDRPVVVPNTPDFSAIAPSPTRGGPIEVVHHGLAAHDRGIELLIHAVHRLGRGYRLNLMLVDAGGGYLKELQRLHAGDPAVRFLDPVPTVRIPGTINHFDIGAFLLPPVTTSRKFALPNKFFEFVQARLAIAVGPSPDMSRLVQTYGLGVVARDFTAGAMADAIATLDVAGIDAAKAASDRAARSLSWETTAPLLHEAVERARNRATARLAARQAH